jgi:hypothetical protein
MNLCETGGKPTLEAVPKRFGRARRALERSYRRRSAQVNELIRRLRPSAEIAIGIDYLAARFEDASSIEGLHWRPTLRVIGTEYGLLDIDDRPLPSLASMIPRLRRAHRKGLREFREAKAAEQRFRFLLGGSDAENLTGAAAAR